MNADAIAVSVMRYQTVHALMPYMKEKPITYKPIEKEILRLHQAGKSPDLIAIRTGLKMSKVLSILNMSATGR